MCGITGLYLFNKEKASNRLAKVITSNDKMLLRGPDCGDVFVNDRIAIGQRRLSIIDTSAVATQPMIDTNGRYVIVFNGEIFNYQDLSNKYLSDTWSRINGPKSSSDTEVLLYLLIEYGTKCINWLSGFFAFAFFDTETEEMIIARDRYGKKPLVYYNDGDFFAFSSEMKALLEWDIPKEIDYTSLFQYLQLNYIPQPQSLFKGVAKVKQGHYLILTPNGVKEDKAYYTLATHQNDYKQFTYDGAKEKLVSLMDSSVQERLISDVPLGAFLSGGIDSSVIVALASRHTKSLNTFSIGYKDNPYFDETKYARLVADKYKTNHTVFSLSNNDFLEHLYGVLEYIDEPFADSSALPVYILSQNTRKHVTVALSGDGGDEVFAGYNKHAAEWRVRQSSFINTIVKAGAPIWKSLPHSRNGKFTNKFRQLSRFAEGAQLGNQERYWRWASFNNAQQVNDLLSEKSKSAVDQKILVAEKANILSCIKTDDYNEILLTDMNLVLISDMLVKVDLMSMANSLEVRSPFLDQKVVDFAFGLPSEYKINGQLKKRIVQDAFRPMLPEELYNRPKQGFEIPLLGWFRNELWSLINDDLLSSKFVEEQGVFNVTATEALKKKLKSNNPEDAHATIWALIVFQYWWKKYLL